VQGVCRKAGWVNRWRVAESMDEEDVDSSLVDLVLLVELAEERGGVSRVSFSAWAGIRCAARGASRQEAHRRRYRSFRHRSEGGFAAQFRQTTVPHFLHGATRSRAQCLSFPIL
jgi:hypothetical protein